MATIITLPLSRSAIDTVKNTPGFKHERRLKALRNELARTQAKAINIRKSLIHGETTYDMTDLHQALGEEYGLHKAIEIINDYKI